MRKLISDFAIILAILIFCGVDMLVGVDTPKLIVPTEFKVKLRIILLFWYYQLHWNVKGLDFDLENIHKKYIDPDRKLYCLNVSI